MWWTEFYSIDNTKYSGKFADRLQHCDIKSILNGNPYYIYFYVSPPN